MRNLLNYSDNVSPAKYTGSMICERLVKNLNKVSKNLNKVSKKCNNKSNDLSQSINIRQTPAQHISTTDRNSPRVANKSVPNLKIPGFVSPKSRESPTRFHKIINAVPELSVKTQSVQDSEISGRKSRIKSFIGYSSPIRAFSPDVTLTCIGRSDKRPTTVNFTRQIMQTQNGGVKHSRNIHQSRRSMKSRPKFKQSRDIDEKKIIGIEFRLQERKVQTAAVSFRSTPMYTQSNSYTSSQLPLQTQSVKRNNPISIFTEVFLPKLPSVKIRPKNDNVNMLSLEQKIKKYSLEPNEKGTTTGFISDDEETYQIYQIDSRYNHI